MDALEPLLWSTPEGLSSVGWQRIVLLRDRPRSCSLCAAEADKQQGQRVVVAEGVQALELNTVLLAHAVPFQAACTLWPKVSGGHPGTVLHNTVREVQFTTV